LRAACCRRKFFGKEREETASFKLRQKGLQMQKEKREQKVKSVTYYGGHRESTGTSPEDMVAVSITIAL